MDADHEELVRRLFVLATEIAETAHERAAAGQSAGRAPEAHICTAKELVASGRSMTMVAEAILAALDAP